MDVILCGSVSQCFKKFGVHTDHLGIFFWLPILIQQVQDRPGDSAFVPEIPGDVHAAAQHTTLSNKAVVSCDACTPCLPIIYSCSRSFVLFLLRNPLFVFGYVCTPLHLLPIQVETFPRSTNQILHFLDCDWFRGGHRTQARQISPA